MGAFAQLSAYYGNVIDKAKELNYSEENLLILAGNEQALKDGYPEVYANLLSSGHNKDDRSYMEYAQDLVASWVFEDDLTAKLVREGLRITGAGADKKRKILAHDQISAGSDFLVSWRGRRVLLELMSDYAGYWTKYGQIDLRDDKYNKLLKSDSLFLGVSTKDQKFILLDFSTNIPASYIASHRPYGGKPAYQVTVNKNSLLPFDIERLVELIKAIIETRPV